jgi:hypothetical protein
VGGGVAFPRRPSSLAPEPGADEMVLRKKPFEILMGRTDIAHTLSPLKLIN